MALPQPSDSMDASDSKLLSEAQHTLKLLEMQERVARYNAARLELEALMEEAKQGNGDRLQAWLANNRTIVGELGEAARIDVSLTNSVAFQRFEANSTEINPSTDFASSNAVQAAVAPVQTKPTTTVESHGGWSTLVTASQLRQQKEVNHISQASCNPAVSPESHAVDHTGSTEALQISPVAEAMSKDEVPQVELAAAASTSSVALSAEVRSERESVPNWLVDSSKPKVSLPTKNFNIAAAINDPEGKPDTQKRALRWLSGSVGVSLMLHILLTVVLGVAYYQITQPTEPLQITSSKFEETETLDTPVEMPEMEQLEVTEVSNEMPAPAMTTAFESAVVAPAAFAEVAVGPMSAPASSAIGSAISEASGVVGGTGTMSNAVQFFGVSSAGNTFAFLVDNSGSIRADGVFEMAKMELMRSIRALKSTQRFFVAFFGKETQVMVLDGRSAEYPIYATPENMQKLENWVRTVQIQDGRHPGDAIEMAIELEPDAIFLMFDGATKVDLPAQVRKVNRVTDLISGERPKVPINTIRFPPSKSDAKDELKFDAMMKKLADENGGNYRFVPKPNGAVGKR